jgi:hypothetical protein
MKSSVFATGGKNRRWRKRWRTVWPAGLLALNAALVGCESAPLHLSMLQRNYQPDNVFAFPAKLSRSLQRVAVLPVAAETPGNDLPAGCAALTPVLWEQLIKTKKFEVVAVDPVRLRSGTGQPSWTGAESLPPDFLGFLRREYGCDGVLFAELTTYRAYAPLAVGWRFKLVDARSGQVIWAADELFDATKPSVAHAVQRFTEPGLVLPLVHEENWVAINSPSQFGRYSAAALLETLPNR